MPCLSIRSIYNIMCSKCLPSARMPLVGWLGFDGIFSSCRLDRAHAMEKLKFGEFVYFG